MRPQRTLYLIWVRRASLVEVWTTANEIHQWSGIRRWAGPGWLSSFSRLSFLLPSMDQLSSGVDEETAGLPASFLRLRQSKDRLL